MTSHQERYSLFLRAIHWLMAIGVFFMWGCGYYMTSIVKEDTNLEDRLFSLHISVGVLLMLLLMVRVTARVFTTTPQAATGLSKAETIGSRLGHAALYLLPALIITIGWAETDFGGHGVSAFGVEMYKIFPTTESLAGVNLEATTALIHKWLAYLMLGLTLIHIGAVIKHRREGNDVLYRMRFGKR